MISVKMFLKELTEKLISFAKILYKFLGIIKVLTFLIFTVI